MYLDGYQLQNRLGGMTGFRKYHCGLYVIVYNSTDICTQMCMLPAISVYICPGSVFTQILKTYCNEVLGKLEHGSGSVVFCRAFIFM